MTARPGAAERPDARGGDRARAGAHGADRRRRARVLLGAAAGAAAARRGPLRPPRRPRADLARGAAPRDRERRARQQAGVRVRGREPRPGQVARPARGPLHGAPGGAVPDARGGLQGLGVFYYGADTARPGPDALEHLAEIPRSISVALELVATLNTVKAAERALELALAGRASIGGLEHLVSSLETLRDRLGEIRSRPDVPPWFAEHYVRARAGARGGARRRPLAARLRARRDPQGHRLPRRPARRAAHRRRDGRARAGRGDGGRRRGAAAGGAARARRRGALARRRQLGAARDQGRGVDRRRAPDRALADASPAETRALAQRGARPRPRPPHRASSTAARSRTIRRAARS